MRVLIIGASKGIGLETTRQALGPAIMWAPWRDPPPGWRSQSESRKGSRRCVETRDVEAALIGVDVVIQTLGVGLGGLFRPVHLFSDATRVLLAAMKAQASNV